MSEKPEQEQPKEKEEKPKAKKEAEAAPAAESPKAEGGEHRKKVSRMTLQEVESEIKSVKEKMGGFQSGFARHLLARRKELAESKK